MRQVAACAALGSSQLQLFLQQKPGCDFRWGDVFSRYHPFAASLLQGMESGVECCFVVGAPFAAGADAQAYEVQVRQIRQLKTFRKSCLERFQVFAQQALGYVDYRQGAVGNRCRPEAFADARKAAVFHDVLHLVRNAGHADQHLAVAVEPHARCCTAEVHQGFTGGRQYGLSAVDFQHHPPPVAEIALQQGKHFGVLAFAACVIIAQYLFRDIILGRTQSARHQHQIHTGKSRIQGLSDFMRIIGHRTPFFDADSVLV